MEVVAIGGGTGLSTLLRGLKQYVARPPRFQPDISRLTTVVTVTESRRSAPACSQEDHVARHDPRRLAQIVLDLAGRRTEQWSALA